MVPWIPDFDKVPPSGMLQFREEDCISLPSDEGQQVELQLGEDVTLYQVRNGQLNINVGTLTSKPTTSKQKITKQEDLTEYIQKTEQNNIIKNIINNIDPKRYTQTKLDKILESFKPKRAKVVDIKIDNFTATTTSRVKEEIGLEPIEIDYTIKPSGNPIPTFIKQLTKNEYFTKKN